MLVEYSIFTDKGSRPVNEDYAGFAQKGGAYCFILCDGLGGHGMGEDASRFVTETVKDLFLSSTETDSFLRSVTEDVQPALRQRQIKENALGRMKTTAAVLVLDGGRGCSVHIGDSRLYRFRNGRVISRTRDHSIPQMLCITGDITEDEIRRHPDRNKLLRALGDDSERVKWETSAFEVCAGDSFLLCSDGFWEPVAEKEMLSALSADNAKGWLGIMSSAAKRNGGDNMDNYTAITVMVKG